MSVRIRLRRTGKLAKRKPHFRIAVFDQRCSRDGRSIEILGYYNPVNKAMKINLTRLDYWVDNGAQMSATVRTLAKRARKEKK